MMGRMSSGSCFISFGWKSGPGSLPPSADSHMGPLELLISGLESSGEPAVALLSWQPFWLDEKLS